MSSIAEPRPAANDVDEAVLAEVRRGLLGRPRTMAPWLFYDERGSMLFERITELPEYYLTRTERGIFAERAGDIVEEAAAGGRLTVLELGAGTATKTGVLLRAIVARQGEVVYRPVDVSETALEEARQGLGRDVPGVTVRPCVANYVTAMPRLERPEGCRAMALYIGSSIGNFDPEGAIEVLRGLRAGLTEGDTLLLGTDLAPSEHKSVERLLAAYDDGAGVTAEFNRNVLRRLNRELGMSFAVEAWAHEARWNPAQSRIEMHLRATRMMEVEVPGGGERVRFERGETIHTENSYKFTDRTVAELLGAAGFGVRRVWRDAEGMFAVTLADVRA